MPTSPLRGRLGSWLQPVLSVPAGNLRRRSAARSSPGLFASVLDSSTLEEATNNFSFEEVAQIPCPAQQVSRVRKTTGLLVYCVTECPNLLLKALELEGGDGGSTGQLGAGGEVEEREEEQASQTEGLSQLCHSQSVRLWTRDFTYPSLYFLPVC